MDGVQGILNKSMRNNYEAYGVEEYYNLVGSTYRNPHFPAIKQCLFTWLNVWWLHDSQNLLNHRVPILDLAAGSGEVTICVRDWWRSCTRITELSPGDVPLRTDLPPSQKKAHPPHRPFIPPLLVQRNLQSSAPASPILDPFAPQPAIIATDPVSPHPVPLGSALSTLTTLQYTAEAYLSRTGHPCHSLSFQDIALGSLPPIPQQSAGEDVGANIGSFNSVLEMAICSFALHLIGTPSELFALLWELSTKARWLVVISPHKKPEIKDNWGWDLWDVHRWEAANVGGQPEILKNRVHCRVFRSLNTEV